MITFLQIASLLTLAASTASGAAIERRGDIPHDQVGGWTSTTVPDGTRGDVYKSYQPYLKVINGCVPFPAVNQNGDTSGGLAPTGDTDGQCAKSPGQIYARAENYNGQFAIMYSWFWPKDEGSPGIGHRYDWESVVVWLTEEGVDAGYVGIAASAHGNYNHEKPGSSVVHWNGNRPFLKYASFQNGGIDHSLAYTGDQGGEQPLIAYEDITDAAWDALTNKDWGAATVPFIDSQFEKHLEQAKI